MDDFDKKNHNAVRDQEFEEPLDFGKWNVQKNFKKRVGFAILSALILSSLGVIVILQVVMVTRQSLVRPNQCNTDCTSKSDPVADMNGGQDTSQILKQMSHLMNMTNAYVISTQNNTGLLQQILYATQGSAQMLTHVVRSLSSLETTNSATQGAIDDILVVVEKLLMIQNGSLIFSSHIPISCNEIQQKQPDSPSGYYNLNGKLVYCHMGKLCDTEGAWTRLGQFDISDSTVSCPSGFKLYESGGVRACGRPTTNPGCASIRLPSNGISYSEVCGRVVGYQYASSDAVDTRFKSNSTHYDIDSYYVDGVSITQGFPRKHIWTLMAGVKDSSYDFANCPCNTPPGQTQKIQPFVGNDYFCESGNPNTYWTYKLYTDDPLWDGEGCGTQEASCCSASGLPWFHKTFVSSTDYLELRVCGDEPNANEDVPISFFEIYVK